MLVRILLRSFAGLMVFGQAALAQIPTHAEFNAHLKGWLGTDILVASTLTVGKEYKVAIRDGACNLGAMGFIENILYHSGAMEVAILDDTLLEGTDFNPLPFRKCLVGISDFTPSVLSRIGLDGQLSTDGERLTIPFNKQDYMGVENIRGPQFTREYDNNCEVVFTPWFRNHSISDFVEYHRAEFLEHRRFNRIFDSERPVGEWCAKRNLNGNWKLVLFDRYGE